MAKERRENVPYIRMAASLGESWEKTLNANHIMCENAPEEK